MYFPLSDYSLEDLTRLQLITSMFGQLPTKNTGLRDLRKRVKALLGRESVGIQLFSARGERKKCIPCLSVYFAALESKAEPACRLVSEILRYIGALVAVVMFTSSALAMTVIPGLLNAFDPKFMWSKEEREQYKAKVAADKANA